MSYLNNPFIKFIVALALVFSPIRHALLTVFCLVIADMVLGTLASKKRGEPITSAGFGRTVVKLFVYSAAICFAFLTQHYLTGEIFPVLNIVNSLVGLTEIKSLIESLNELSGTNLLKVVLDKLSSANYTKGGE